MEKDSKQLTEEFVRSVISHEDDIEEILEAMEDDTIEYIRHDLFTKLQEAGANI